ncbi:MULTISPECIES: phosphoglycolate phosphatase [Alphaproteobacteria]|uniref:Phosphoglycolate phosphatase n=2 Tax=Alphaproteobacteria TaxID=28211 RepID=A0A512HCE9_9HYPH|nr:MULTISPECIES: phosphoglycolate phosphatase [Alphaproteobacteria]GEO83122.1 phosphoglycolate phosphatase [Ciceribacter naphthalenivorans]GLR20482.1 phosphoglycolate phosphatase [Ciceribacter naphthalenivorans]GLT03338.1 phosphoglycolate phosphatase [Sphingomonas psychrolutea]
MKAPTIVFDLDGTLVDTAPDLVASLNHTIAAASLAPVGYDDLTHLVGQGARAMIARAFALRGEPLAEEEIQPLLDRFIAHYMAEMPGKSRPYPGLIDALDRLTEAGFILAVCTNKMEALAVPLVEKLGLGRHFSAIAGGDTFAVRKPDPGHIIATIEKAGGDPRHAVMIGDSVNDILAARNAGIPSIVVPFGYSDVPIAELGADRQIDHFDELTPVMLRQMMRP